MYVARVVTNETCNQNCGFCTARRPTESPAIAAAGAVRARIEAAVRGGAREVVLTGGEPTLRRDLPALVALARRAGAARVTLETNGALLDGPRAEALARAGLGRARVHVPVWGEDCDAVTRDEGGFLRTRAAIDALVGAGIEVEIAAPVVRATADRLPDLPAAAREAGARAVVIGAPLDAPRGREDELLPAREATLVIARTAEAARAAGIAARLDAPALPPCLFVRPVRVAHLFTLTPGGASRPDHARLPACDACAVRDRCPGVPRAALAREPDLADTAPLRDDHLRRRLSLVSTVEEQIARELCTRDVRQRNGAVLHEHIVRVNFHCNQACRFCFVSTHLPPAAHEAVVAAIDEIGALRGVLTLSGGEPTLNPRLAEYARLGKERGAVEVEVQTNAIRLADPALTGALVAAGVDRFFVSLHAHVADVSDAITEAPGTFEKTVRGIDAIARTGATLRLNFVFCERNHALFPDYVRAVAARWPRASITISFVAPSTDLVPRERALIPRYADVRPHLAEGIRAARALGVTLHGFESMCALPLCQVPDELSELLAIPDIIKPSEGDEFLKPEVCSRCDLGARCFGIRRGYAELHGTSELAPVVAG